MPALVTVEARDSKHSLGLQQITIQKPRDRSQLDTSRPPPPHNI